MNLPRSHSRIEIEGYRREDAKEKKVAMETCWVPGVNNLRTFGRWAFAVFTEVSCACRRSRIADMAIPYYTDAMKTLTVRLPDALAAEIQAESRRRKLSKSDIVRERLSVDTGPSRPESAALDAIADLIGSVDELPADLSTRKKRYLRTTGYGRKRPR